MEHEVRNQGSGGRDQGSEIRGQGSGIRGQRSGVKLISDLRLLISVIYDFSGFNDLPLPAYRLLLTVYYFTIQPIEQLFNFLIPESLNTEIRNLSSIDISRENL